MRCNRPIDLACLWLLVAAACFSLPSALHLVFLSNTSRLLLSPCSVFNAPHSLSELLERGLSLRVHTSAPSPVSCSKRRVKGINVVWR
jgi:hypothetical protein